MICRTCHGVGWLGPTLLDRGTMSYFVQPEVPCHTCNGSLHRKTDDPAANDVTDTEGEGG